MKNYYNAIEHLQDEFYAFFFENELFEQLLTYYAPQDDYIPQPSFIDADLDRTLNICGDFDVVFAEDPADEGPALWDARERTLYLPDGGISEAALLHEMLHIYETRLARLPQYYRDALCFSLVTRLQKTHPEIMAFSLQHLALPEQESFRERIRGKRSDGPHGWLFLLASFALDLRNGWPLGTVLTAGESDFTLRYFDEADDE